MSLMFEFSLGNVIWMTALFELVTIFSRLKLGSIKKFYKKTKIKFRFHHGYTGVLMMLAYFILPYEILLSVGSALILSDLLHHFVVLPLWIGEREL